MNININLTIPVFIDQSGYVYKDESGLVPLICNEASRLLFGDVKQGSYKLHAVNQEPVEPSIWSPPFVIKSAGASSSCDFLEYSEPRVFSLFYCSVSNLIKEHIPFNTWQKIWVSLTPEDLTEKEY